MKKYFKTNVTRKEVVNYLDEIGIDKNFTSNIKRDELLALFAEKVRHSYKAKNNRNISSYCYLIQS